jgi:AcrR family transcriptional regulator
VDEADKTSAGGARRNAHARRERIISAARSLFAKHGFHGTGMAQIARSSEVLVGQIYRDFAGKEDLIAAIVERDVAEIMNDPELAGAMATGEADQLDRWIRGFIGRGMDDETRSVLADILSEATRNAKISAMLNRAHDHMRDRLVRAAQVWSAAPEKESARHELADLVMTAAGAIQHRHIFGLTCNEVAVRKMVDLVETEVAKLTHDT